MKPSNLLATLHGEVKLLDLGLALQRSGDSSDVRERSGALGTSEYMAPEQWTRAWDVDERADLYALGCTLFKL
ncbi:MAG: serine/threonine protein kinase, partial [Planctomycetales bacterium]|nr:serine/threonine protein kinase [Planctomycetales bacterium]